MYVEEQFLFIIRFQNMSMSETTDTKINGGMWLKLYD